MKEFQTLLDLIDRLLAPDGCPWDRDQTMKSIRSDLIEESCELVDAIDSEDNEHIEEELGDVLFVVAFLCRLAEKEKRCTIQGALREINEKLIRRHPHVFGETKIETQTELLEQWEAIKSKEKGKTLRKSVLDSIPKGLPALARAKKVYKKIQDKPFSALPTTDNLPHFDDEAALGKVLFSIVAKAQNQGLEAEHALRQTLVSVESAFRDFETQKGQ